MLIFISCLGAQKSREEYLLTTQTRQSAEQARLRERESRILYESGRVINNTDHLDEQLDSIVLALVRVFSPWGVRECALLLPDEDGTLIIRADAPIRIESFTFSQEEMLEAREALGYGKIRQMSTTSLDSPLVREGSNSILRLIPLKAENEVLGLLCLRNGSSPTIEDRSVCIRRAVPL